MAERSASVVDIPTSGDGPAIEPILRLEALETGYGKKQVLNEVSFDVGRGEIVALIGHNGAGKSTLLKAIFGMIPVWSGRVAYDGQVVEELHPRTLLNAGLAYVPQGNSVFGDLSVKDNLYVAGVTLSTRRAQHVGVERALAEFPSLRKMLKRRAATLSGGEKQMLTLAMSLVLQPRLVLLDEPSLGLAPPLVRAALQRIELLRADKGLSVLIVEQKVREVLEIADQVVVVQMGRVVWHGAAATLRNDRDKLRQVYL